MMILTPQQRFIRNTKNSPFRRNGVDENIRIGMKYPTHSQMNQFERYGVAYDVDPALRDVVIELNKRGYRTSGSCQGHNLRNKVAFVNIEPSKNEFPIDYGSMSSDIYSLKNININEIKSIFKKYGIIINGYTPPSFIKGKLRPFHSFNFPVILDEIPPPDIVYWYKSLDGDLIYTQNKKEIPKTKYVYMIFGLDLDHEHYYHKIFDNGKVIWNKSITAFDATPCSKAKLSIEVQRVVRKALDIVYNDKKIVKEFTEGLKKCKVGRK